MKKRKKLEKILLPVVFTALALTLFTLYQFERQSIETGAELNLRNLKASVEQLLISEFKKNDGGAFFKEPRISFDPVKMSVTPSSLKTEVLSRLEFKTTVFSEDTLERIKALKNSGDPKLVSSLLAYYLNDRKDGFIIEKAFFYLYLIDARLAEGLDPEKEMAAFRKLAAMITDEREKNFLTAKFGEIIKAARAKSSPDDSTLLNAMMDPDEKKNAPNETVFALTSAVLADMAANSNPTLKSVSVNGLEKLMLSGKIADSLFSAAFIDIDKLNVEVKAKFNAAVSLESLKGERFADLARPFKIYSGSPDSPGLILQRTLLYLPLVIIIAGLAYLKMRENEAVRLNLQMTEFVSKIAHQLKTPLSSSLLHLELAERYFKAGDAVKAREALSSSQDQARHLSFLFENFAVLNRLFSDNVSLAAERLDIEEELMKYLKSYSYHIETGILKVIIEDLEPLDAMADRWALYNILNNLVANSLKYSGKKPVEIRISMHERGKFAVLSLADNGPGIPEGEADMIFEKFFKGKNAESDFRSTGLGLYIAGSLAQKSGGKIVLDAKYTSGAKFDIYLRKAD
ncbi:MAG TPA: HAMP domain-containing sensor histidine kinase [Candidatus Wallbacteria bacterium]|nr:HAMP domain-containing sensor histidine kinase [Candidatus Wallbacteria bacterium]